MSTPRSHSQQQVRKQGFDRNLTSRQDYEGTTMIQNPERPHVDFPNNKAADPDSFS